MILLLLSLTGLFLFLRQLGRRFFFASIQRRMSNEPLAENCLLTRFPIVILVSSPSLLRPLLPWKSISEFLNRHGYQVQLIPIDQMSDLPNLVEQIGRPIHLFLDQTLSKNLEVLHTFPQKTVMSVTCIQHEKAAVKNLAIGPVTPLQILSVKDPQKLPQTLLNHVVQLAERDFA